MMNLLDKIIMIYYLLVNILAFYFYKSDKDKAQNHQRRIPEKTLFLTAFLGGAFGALAGMQFCHHKTRKTYFWILNLTAVILHGILLYVLLFRLSVS